VTGPRARSRGPGPPWPAAVAALAVALLLGAGTPIAAQDDPDDPPPGPTGPVELSLVAQTPVVTPPGRVDLRLGIAGAPPDSFVELVLRGQVRTRSEFALAVDGEALRTRVDSGTRPRLDTLPVDPADGARTVSLSLDPGTPGGINLSSSGAYPLEVRVVSAGGEPLGELLTFVVVAPAPDTELAPLSVAVVGELGAPPADRGGDGPLLDDEAATLLAAAAAPFAGVPDVPATLSIVPETVDALAATPSEVAAQALARLREATAGRAVLARPFTDVSVQALVDADLEDELDQHLIRGQQVLVDELGVEPSFEVAIAGGDLDPTGAVALVERGVDGLVLDGDDLAPAPTGGLSLAHRFQVPIARVGNRTVDAVEADAALEARLTDDDDPALAAQRLVAELAVVRGEQPAVPRGVVVRAGADARPEVVASLLAALDRAGTLLDPVDLPTLFQEVRQLTDPAGGPVQRDLVPEDAPAIGQDVAAGLPGARQLVAGYESLTGGPSPRSQSLQTALLLATARDLTLTERRDHLRSVRTEVDEVVDGITLPARPRVTLTARSGTIPLTIGNGNDFPVEVVARLDSTRLEFPTGAERPLTLVPGSTRADLAVRARTSGGFPLDVTLVSPDGSIELGTTRYTVQSTAFSGVGLILSLGAGLFLVLWWGSHWHRTRRSRRLVPLEPEPPTGAT
jgi:hypothetical protein